jgi:hypothetical protein
MSGIYILHASDIHLAKRPLRQSILDQASIATNVAKNFYLDLWKHLRSGELRNLKETFAGILSRDNIALLEESQSIAEHEDLNAKIDLALGQLVLSEDPFFRDFIAEITRTVGFATSYHPLALDSLVNFVLSRSELDAIILSGDIATTGFEHDLLKAKEFLDGPPAGAYAAGLSVLANIGPPVWILPGNHDRYTYTGQEWFFSPGGTLFDQILSNHWSGKVKAYPPLRNADKRLSVLILAADFCLQKSSDSTRLHRFNKLAQGRVYEEVLSALETETLSQREQETLDFPNHELVTLWAVHFPPAFEGLSASKSLLQAADLVSKAEDLDVQALLAGHTHIHKDYSATPYVRVLCAGTATQNDSATKHCQIISIERTSGHSSAIDVNHYEWDRDAVTFRPMKKRL